jgi:mannose-1-phosphate guanylyltransferase
VFLFLNILCNLRIKKNSIVNIGIVIHTIIVLYFFVNDNERQKKRIGKFIKFVEEPMTDTALKRRFLQFA